MGKELIFSFDQKTSSKSGRGDKLTFNLESLDGEAQELLLAMKAWEKVSEIKLQLRKVLGLVNEPLLYIRGIPLAELINVEQTCQQFFEHYKDEDSEVHISYSLKGQDIGRKLAVMLQSLDDEPVLDRQVSKEKKFIHYLFESLASDQGGFSVSIN